MVSLVFFFKERKMLHYTGPDYSTTVLSFYRKDGDDDDDDNDNYDEHKSYVAGDDDDNEEEDDEEKEKDERKNYVAGDDGDDDEKEEKDGKDCDIKRTQTAMNNISAIVVLPVRGGDLDRAWYHTDRYNIGNGYGRKTITQSGGIIMYMSGDQFKLDFLRTFYIYLMYGVSVNINKLYYSGVTDIVQALNYSGVNNIVSALNRMVGRYIIDIVSKSNWNYDLIHVLNLINDIPLRNMGIYKYTQEAKEIKGDITISTTTASTSTPPTSTTPTTLSIPSTPLSSILTTSTPLSSILTTSATSATPSTSAPPTPLQLLQPVTIKHYSYRPS
jgi:hypothetical protein